MDLLVIGAGQMGSAAAYDMARSRGVRSVTLADADKKRAKAAAARIQDLLRTDKVHPVALDVRSLKDARKLMARHQAALSAVPYFYNAGLTEAAIDARCHFADLGGNNDVVRKQYDLAKKGAKRGVAVAPDCGLSPGMASILAGELMRRLGIDPAADKPGLLSRGPRADALKIYVGGLPKNPKPPFYYQMVFSVEGLINEYVEPAKVLRNGRVITIEPLTEPEDFYLRGFPKLTAFHTSGGTSTLPETFAGRVGECFEKTLRYPSHYQMVRSLYQLGFFSSDKMPLSKGEVAPREITSRIFEQKFAGTEPDVVILRVEAHASGRKGILRKPDAQRVAAFTLVDYADAKTGMTGMMRTTAWPASIVVQMLASGAIEKRGGIRQEVDVPAQAFLDEMAARGVHAEFSDEER